jgi:hypothetical protein
MWPHEAGPGLTAQDQSNERQHLLQADGVPGIRRHDGGQPLDEDLAVAGGMVAEEAAHV